MKLQKLQEMGEVSENPLTFKKYFTNIWDAISSTYKGMKITLKYVYGVKEVTLQYPEEKEQLPLNSRSRLFNDVENCIACMQCSTACPVSCIYISAVKRDKDAPKVKTSSGSPVRSDLTMYIIDEALCCYCGLCTTVCPTECLTHTRDYEFSQYFLEGMKYDYLAPEIRAWRTRLVKDQ